MTNPKIIHCYIVCKHPAVPAPESLVDALTQAGHLAKLIEVHHSYLTSLTAEIALGNSLSRVYVDVSEDFHEFNDHSTSDWEVVEELVGTQEARVVRRLAHVRAWEHADPAAVECLTDTLCMMMDGRVPERQTW